MIQTERTLTLNNIQEIIQQYTTAVEEIGASIQGLKGLKLLEILKREKVLSGPYPNVTLFEAANRIMTDIVILYGIRWLLNSKEFPFEEYKVEFGNEDNNGFDIYAKSDTKCLIGEAFNVAPSFFQVKKTAMLKKLRKKEMIADYRIIMFNHDAVEAGYSPRIEQG